MNLTRRAEWSVTIASGVAFGLSQPGFDLWPLAFATLPLLLCAIRGHGPGRRIAYGWVAGTIGATIATSSAGVVGTARYFGIPSLHAAGVSVGLGQMIGASSFVLFALMVGRAPRGLSASWRCGASWTAIELLHSIGPFGLPWLLLSACLAPVPLLAGPARWVGALGLSGLIAAVGAVAICCQGRVRAVGLTTVVGIWVATSVILLPEGGRVWSSSELADASRPTSKVLLVQTGAGPEGTIPHYARLRRLVSLSAPADLIVWPESSIGVMLPANLPGLLEEAESLLSLSRAGWILGATWSEPDGTFRNSALWISPSGQIDGSHHKVRLFPFGEYAPGSWAWRGRGPEMTAGSAMQTLATPAGRLGPLICYEILFPDLARAQVRGGAEVLLQISNDAWFDGTVALAQHRAAAVLRAIETARPLLRATTTGLTMAINARGEVVATLPAQSEGALSVEVQPNAEFTPYVQAGWLVPWGCLFAAIGTAARGAARAAARRAQPG